MQSTAQDRYGFPLPELDEPEQPPGGAGQSSLSALGRGALGALDPTGLAQASLETASDLATPMRPLDEYGNSGFPVAAPLDAGDRFSQAMSQWERQIPYLASALEAKDLYELHSASQAMQAGSETPEQFKLVTDFLEKQQGSKTLGYKVVDILSGIVPFVGEMAGGMAVGRKLLGKTVSKALFQAAEKGATRSLVQRIASGAAKTAAIVGTEAAVSSAIGAVTGGPMGGRITADAYRRAVGKGGMQLTEDDAGRLAVTFNGTVGDFMDSLPQAVASQVIEVGSELAGGALLKGAEKVPGLAKVAAAQNAVMDWWLKKYPKSTVREFVQKVAKEGGWNGPVGEYLEERAGAAARALVPGMEEGFEDIFPSLHDQAAELIAFSIPTGLGIGATALDAKLQDSAATLDPEVVQRKEGESVEDLLERTQGQGAPESTAHIGTRGSRPQEKGSPPVEGSVGDVHGVDDAHPGAPEIDPATIPEAAAPMGQREGAEPQAVVHASEIQDRQKRKRYRTAAALLDRFGVRVVPVSSGTGEALAQPAMAGEQGVVYWDVNTELAPLAEGELSDRGGLETRGRAYHELVHELAWVDPQTYTALESSIGKYVSPEVRNGVLADYRQRLGQNIPESIRDEETVANLTESLSSLLVLADKKHGTAALEQIARNDFGLFQKILDMLKKMSNRIANTEFKTAAEKALRYAAGVELSNITPQEAANAALLVNEALNKGLAGRQAPRIAQDQAGAEAPTKPQAPSQKEGAVAPGTPIGKPLPGRAADLPAPFTATQEAKVRRRLKRAERAARTLREKAEKATPEEASRLRARAVYQDQRAKDYRDQLKQQEDLQLGEEAREVQDEAARRRPFEREMAPRRTEETRMERARRLAADGEERPDRFAARADRNPLVKRVFAGFDVPDESFIDAARRKLQDEFLRIQRIEEAARQRGADIPFEKSAYEAASSAQSRTRGAVGKFERRHVAPLIRTLQAMSTAGVSLEAADRYLYARHAPSRNEAIAERHPKKYGDVEKSPGSGMATSEANKIVQTAESSEQAALYKKLGEQMDRMVAESLKTRLDGELISQDYYDTLTSQWEHYVPLKDDREGVSMGRGGGFAIKGKEFKRAGGRSEEAENVIAHAIQQGSEGISRAERNRVGLAFLRMLRDNRSVTNWSETRPEEPVDPRLLSERQFSLKENGQQIVMEFEDPKTVRALKKMGQEQFGPILRLMRRAAGMWSQLNTTLSPDFVLTNLIRDLGTAGIHLSSEQKAAIAGMSIKNVPKAARGMYRFLTESEKGGEWSDAAELFAQEGGMVGWYYMPTVAEIQAKVVGSIKDVDPSGARRALIAARATKDWIETLNQSLENGVRLSAFKALVDSGTAPGRAATIARRLTVDFTRRGELSPITNTLWIFSNASIQGTATMLRVLNTRRGKQIATGLVGVGAAFAYLNVLAGGDDDDGYSHYSKIPDWIRDRNLVLMDPRGTGDYIKIPLPQGWNMFFALGEKGAMAALGQTTTKDAAEAMLGASFEQFVPLGGESSAAQFAAPTLLDPVVQHLENRTFFGGKIKPEQSQFGPTLPESEMHFKSVSAASKGLAQWLNRVTGGDEVTPGFLDVSPELIDHYAEFIGGSAGASLKRGIVDVPAKVLQGEAPAINEIPVVRRFLGESPEWWTSSTYYDHRDAIERLELQIKNAREKRRPQEANALRRENAALWRLRGPMEATDKQVKALRTRAKTATDKQREVLEKRIAALQMSFNKRAKESLDAVK